MNEYYDAMAAKFAELGVDKAAQSQFAGSILDKGRFWPYGGSIGTVAGLGLDVASGNLSEGKTPAFTLAGGVLGTLVDLVRARGRHNEMWDAAKAVSERAEIPEDPEPLGDESDYRRRRRQERAIRKKDPDPTIRHMLMTGIIPGAVTSSYAGEEARLRRLLKALAQGKPEDLESARVTLAARPKWRERLTSYQTSDEKKSYDHAMAAKFAELGADVGGA